MSEFRRVATAAACAVIALAAGACSSTSTASASGSNLTVGFVVDPSWAQVPVAAASGDFTAEGLDVKVVDFSTGVQALQALEAGQVDVTTAADVPVAAALASASDLKVIADGSRWRGSVIVSSEKTGIRSVQDLGGKKIGTPLGTSAAYFAQSVLKQAGVTAQLVQVDPSAIVTAVQRGNVDAVSVFQPYQQQAITALGRAAAILKPAAGTYTQQSLYLASTNAVTRKAAALRKFELALEKAGHALNSGSAAAINAVAAATQLPATLVRKVLPEFDYGMTMPATLATQLSALGQWAKGAGNLASNVTLPKYAQFISTSFLPAGG